MTYQELMAKLASDPTFVTTLTQEDFTALIKDYSDVERQAAQAEYSRVKQFVVGFGEVFVVHPSWRTNAKITDWGRELLGWGLKTLQKQPWAGTLNVPLGLLWDFRVHVLYGYYEIWYHGQEIPEDWE